MPLTKISFITRLGLVAACSVVLATPDAFASPATEKPDTTETNTDKTNNSNASALQAEAEQLIAAGDCEGAMVPLRSAWKLHEDAKIAGLLAECEIKLGRDPDAANHLSQAAELLAEGAERTRVESMLQDVSSRVGRLDIVVNERGASVIAGRFVGTAPVKHVFVEPGDVEVTVKKSGFVEQQQKIRVAAGETKRLEIKLVANHKTVNFEHGPSRSISGAMLPVYVTGGVAVVAAVFGIGFRVAGKNRGSEADGLLGSLDGAAPCSASSPPADCATIKSLRVEHDQYVNTSTGLFIAGGVLLGGAMIYGTSMMERAEVGVAVLPIIAPMHGGLLIQGQF